MDDDPGLRRLWLRVWLPVAAGRTAARAQEVPTSGRVRRHRFVGPRPAWNNDATPPSYH
ncbi:hypothetical protein GCM10023339_30060 [Alloalcanivorax gelatiniphagus]